MKFVKVEGDGIIYYINPNLVRMVTPYDDGASIRFDDHHSVNVDDPAEKVVKKLDSAL